ncbi:hypothetical protein NHH82_18670 [Oxalobacteraceae bacterium OTU3REALA1]|nr:hypothetical protein NHH82_18670 [Oxalobacteraceae bacterium OTU3REALA1]
MDRANYYRRAALARIKEKVGGYDHYVWGVPTVDGGVDVLASDCDLGKSFLDAYNADQSAKDVMGMLHFKFPRALQVWSAVGNKDHKQSSRKSHDAKSMASWLYDGYGICHLMLTGIESEAGRTWLTLYRKADKPFTKAQADYARFTIPHYLWTWLTELCPDVGTVEIEPASQLTILSAYEMTALLAHAAGGVPDEILARARDELPDHPDLSSGALKKARNRAHRKLGVSSHGALALILGRR